MERANQFFVVSFTVFVVGKFITRVSTCFGAWNSKEYSESIGAITDVDKKIALSWLSKSTHSVVTRKFNPKKDEDWDD